MVLLEFSMSPMNKGESVSAYVARSLEIAFAPAGGGGPPLRVVNASHGRAVDPGCARSTKD